MYAHREESPRHSKAIDVLHGLAEGRAAWGLPVFVVGEFLRVVTHMRILRPPSETSAALGFLDQLLGSPSLRLLSPGDAYWELLRTMIAESGVSGNGAFDAQIAAVSIEHGATTILTENTDFHRFPGITVRRLS